MNDELIYSREVSFPVQATDAIALPGNTKRAGLIISLGSTVANKVFISFKGPTAVNVGMTIWSSYQPVILWGEGIGQALREDVHCIGTVGTNLNIVELFYG